MSTKNKPAREVLNKLLGHVTFGEFLRSYRLGQEITQVEMAQKLKITKQELCQIEKAHKFVSIERAVNFAKILKHSPEVFAKYVIDDELMRAGLKVECELKKAA